MLTIKYKRMGDSYADFEAERIVLKVLRTPGVDEIVTSTINVVRAAQMLIAEGKIDPIEIRFTYENDPIRHDRFGRLFELPGGYDETIVRIHMRYRSAVQKRILSEMTLEHREKYQARYQEWFQTNILEIFTPAVPAQDDEPAIAGTKFLFVPEEVGKKRIEPQPGVDIRVVVGFADTNHGPAVLTDKGALPMNLVEHATFDTMGDRMVPRPFNTAAVLDEMGFDGSFFARPGFEVE